MSAKSCARSGIFGKMLTSIAVTTNQIDCLYLIPKIYLQTDSSNWSHSDPGIACSKVVDIWFRQVSTVLYLISEMSGKDDFLKTDLFKDIRKLINIIDEVRDYGLDKEISLPRIAVLGTQSSGKSSLL